MILLFANNASTTLASGINATSTTVVLASGTGGLFPNPTAGEQAFYLTIKDAATELTNEIMLCTARSGDVCTVARGQQGTTAVAWNAGDIAAQLVTRGDLEGMVQPDQLQEQIYVATGAAGMNSITATLTSGLTALPDSMLLILRAAAANTGPVTLTLTLGSTVLPAENVVKYGGSALNADDIPAAGFPMMLIWSATLGAYVLTNPASGTAGSIAGGAANDLLVQTAPGTTGFVPAPTVAGSVLAFIGGVISWAAAAVTQFGPAGNKRSGDVTPETGDYTAAQVSAVAASAFAAPRLQLGNPSFVVLPGGSSAGGDGMLIQAGSRAIAPNALTTITFPHAFPNACIAVVVTNNNNANVATVNSFNSTFFTTTSNANFVSWIAIGW